MESLARGCGASARLAWRARVVLLAAAGKENQEIAAELGILRHTVGRWRRRYAQLGLVGIEKDAPRPGRLPTISRELVEQIVRKTIQETPGDAPRWSTRSMARVSGVSEATVRRIWKRHNLNHPHPDVGLQAQQ